MKWQEKIYFPATSAYMASIWSSAQHLPWKNSEKHPQRKKNRVWEENRIVKADSFEVVEHMKEEYISISEFAKRAGISRQAVYKRLSTDLQPFVNQLTGGDSLLQLISMLKKELDVKNNQIEELNARLAESNAALVAAQQTAQAAQALHAGTMQQQLLSSPVEDMREEQSEAEKKDQPWWFFWRKK